MPRVIRNKKLKNTRLATSYGGWMYCDKCNKNIGYLCYVTYDSLRLNYECNCGNNGDIFIDFKDSKKGIENSNELVIIKNRLCCSLDESPLITIIDKNLKRYNFEIVCKSCNKIYKKEVK